jgi:hypothetical protein
MRKVKLHWLGPIAAFALCTGLLVAQAPARQAAPVLPTQADAPSQDPNFKLSSDVNLVNITATVLDERGTYIDGLKQEDFQMFEDGVQQKISSSPTIARYR